MKFNIYEMCAVGIMAYNHFPLYYNLNRRELAMANLKQTASLGRIFYDTQRLKANAKRNDYRCRRHGSIKMQIPRHGAHPENKSYPH